MRRIFGRRGRARLAAAGLAAAALAVFAGCDASENADVERGRALFQQRCGTCHALAQAGTNAEIGPNLDAAFADARKSGMDNDTIEGVVQGQIENPRQIKEGTPEYESVYMPANIVTGQDAEDVSAYVASVAGVPGAAPPELPPEEQFVESCGGCHTLEAAGTAGTVGPNLDEALQGQSRQFILESLVDPNAQIAPGFEPNVMPSFEGALSDEALNELVRYLMQNAGGGSSSNGSAGGN